MTRKARIDTDLKIQTKTMPDRRPVFTFVFDEIRKFKADAIPVASLDCTAKVIGQIAAIVATDKKGVAVRARIEHVMKASFAANLDALLKALKVTLEQTDLIIDLGTPNFEPSGMALRRSRCIASRPTKDSPDLHRIKL